MPMLIFLKVIWFLVLHFHKIYNIFLLLKGNFAKQYELALEFSDTAVYGSFYTGR